MTEERVRANAAHHGTSIPVHVLTLTMNSVVLPLFVWSVQFESMHCIDHKYFTLHFSCTLPCTLVVLYPALGNDLVCRIATPAMHRHTAAIH